ncbi:MAG: TIM barrel protein [Candidatus Aenigmarchaeota archaeon]|nr:TIM barrel protein [Candidatus Aenigmarchaeota archaeon]
MEKLLFGTAGIPISCSSRGGKTLDGVRFVRKLGLDAMELEFVRSVNLEEEKAREVGRAAKEENVILTCHAPYYINLNSKERVKILQSIDRILRSSRIAGLAGAKSVTFHSGFYVGMEKETVYQTIKKNIEGIVKTLRNEGNPVLLRPELTGKPTQFGSLEELIRLSRDIEGVLPCIDFAHLYARSTGKMNDHEKFLGALESIEKGLGKEAINNMHIHMSGIEYGPKGERNHVVLGESGFNWEEALRAFSDFDIRGVVISESPNIEKDAMMMKRKYSDMLK